MTKEESVSGGSSMVTVSSASAMLRRELVGHLIGSSKLQEVR